MFLEISNGSNYVNISVNFKILQDVAMPLNSLLFLKIKLEKIVSQKAQFFTKLKEHDPPPPPNTHTRKWLQCVIYTGCFENINLRFHSLNIDHGHTL